MSEKNPSPFEPSIFSHHLHIMLFPEKQDLFPTIHHMFPPPKKGGNLLPSSPPGLVDGRGQQPLSTIRGASGGSTGGDLKLKAWFQPEQHRHHRFYLFYLSYLYLPVMHIILYIYMYMFIEFTVSTGCFPHSDHWKSLLLNLENMCKKIESNSMLMGNICKMNNFMLMSPL